MVRRNNERELLSSIDLIKSFRMNLTYISEHLNTQKKCIVYLKKRRWKDQAQCPYCESHKCSPKKDRYTCLNCKNSFSVTVGTVFENTKLPLYKWFMAISIILAAKKGVSSLQLSRDINVNKNTAWLMQNKIRTAIEKNELGLLFRKSERGNNIRVKFGKRFIGKPHSRRNMFSFNYLDLSKRSLFGTSFKRAVIGQYHLIDEFYLSRYLSEVDFKIQCRCLKDRGTNRLLSILLLKSVLP